MNSVIVAPVEEEEFLNRGYIISSNSRLSLCLSGPYYENLSIEPVGAGVLDCPINVPQSVQADSPEACPYGYLYHFSMNHTRFVVATPWADEGIGPYGETW